MEDGMPLVARSSPSRRTQRLILTGMMLCAVTPAVGAHVPQEHKHDQTPAAPVVSGSAVTMAELERLALQKNPTIAQAEAGIEVAEGLRKQAGLYPNPIVGYQGEEFATRAFTHKSEHFIFVEQSIVTGGKLKKSRRIFEHEKARAAADAEAQRYRVLNTVRLLYYEALGAQELVDLRRELARVAREAVGISEELYNIGQADKPDLFAVEIEAQRAELDLIMAENDLERAWLQLASVVGDGALPRARLAGGLEQEFPRIDQRTLLAKLLEQSPEVESARAGLRRAQAAVDRAKAERVPDVFVRGGAGYSFEELEPFGGRTGFEFNVEVGVRLPIFNRNQGNIAASAAELVIAEREMQRLELALRARLAGAFSRYANSLRLVERYQSTVLPRAQESYRMYLASFGQMAAAYPQVLISQRTMFQVRAEYINALVDLWQNATRLQGFLLTGGLDQPSGSTREGAPEPQEGER